MEPRIVPIGGDGTNTQPSYHMKRSCLCHMTRYSALCNMMEQRDLRVFSLHWFQTGRQMATQTYRNMGRV